MSTLALVSQVIIALGVANVWLLRSGRPTRWRPEGAANITEEFRRYGLPDWSVKVVGGLKLLLAALLLAGLWKPALAAGAAAGMALLMAGAVVSHLRIGDPPLKALPSFTLLALSLAVVFAQSG